MAPKTHPFEWMEILLRTQLSLVRNLPDERFASHWEEAQGEALVAMLCERLRRCFPKVQEVTDDALVAMSGEVYFGLCPKALRSPWYRLFRLDGVAESPIWIEVGTRNHLHFTTMVLGNELKPVMAQLQAVVAQYEQHYACAFERDWGYLTPQVHLMGTGFRVRTWAHLPGLAHFQHLEQLETALRLFNSAMEAGVVEEEMLPDLQQVPPGALFVIFNSSAMDAPVEGLLERHLQVLQMVYKEESRARWRFRYDDPFVLYDRLLRVKGMLQHVAMLHYDEALDLVSFYRLGSELGVLCNGRAMQLPLGWFFEMADAALGQTIELFLDERTQDEALKEIPPGAIRSGCHFDCARLQLLKRTFDFRFARGFVEEALQWK